MFNIIYANVTSKDIDDIQKKYRMEVPGTFKDDTKFAIYIGLDEPDRTTGTSGSTSDALILAKDIMTELLPYMNVYKDTDEPYVDLGNAPEESGVSDVPVSEPAAATTGSN